MVCDIGSDHAYLPIYLIKMKKTKRAIAADINDGPIKLSKKRIKQNKYESLIEVRQGCGLEPIALREAEIAVIAGMGGLLIIDILKNDPEKARSFDTIIIQPMKDTNSLRKWLYDNRYDIIDEELVKDEGKLYEVLWVKPIEQQISNNNLLLVGPKIIEKKHPLADEFIDKKVREIRKIITQLESQENNTNDDKLLGFKEILDYYLELKECLK